MRLSEFWELLGRREALDRRRQHGVGVGVAVGRAIKLGQTQRGAQFEAARLPMLGDGDRDILLAPTMSAMGQKRTSVRLWLMSA